jgi:tetratricopeptide (TPR) repeat protein
MRSKYARTIITAIISFACASLPAQTTSPIEEIRTLLDQGDFENAIPRLDKRLARNPGDPEALYLRSTAYIMAGDTAAGRRDLESCLDADPERREAWLNLAALELAEEHYPPALEAFRRAEQLDPRAPDNSLNIGATLLLAGDRQAASERFRKYLQSNPDDADAFLLVASNYAMAGLGDIAIPLLERAIALDERTRLRVRTDPNFAELITNSSFEALLDTDSFQPPEDSLQETRTFDVPYAGRDSRVLEATLSALQLAGDPISREIEVTRNWALIWSDVRIKIAAGENGTTLVTATAAPGSFSPAGWSARNHRLFLGIMTQLHALRPEPRSEPRNQRPD